MKHPSVLQANMREGRERTDCQSWEGWAGPLTYLLQGLIVSDKILPSLEWAGASWGPGGITHTPFNGTKAGRLEATFSAQPCVLRAESRLSTVPLWSSTRCFPVDSELRDISQNTFLRD